MTDHRVSISEIVANSRTNADALHTALMVEDYTMGEIYETGGGRPAEAGYNNFRTAVSEVILEFALDFNPEKFPGLKQGTNQ